MYKEKEHRISVFDTVSLCLDKNLTFAAYRFPNTNNPEMVIQTSSVQKTVTETDNFFDLKGFLVAPFTENSICPSFLILPDIYFTDYLSENDERILLSLPDEPVKSDASHTPEEISHSEYINRIKIIIDSICEGKFEKVVLSRVKIIKCNFISKLTELFKRLCNSYPNAFVYIFNAGPHLWVGATPEPLLKSANGTMYTVSLAGTRPYNERNLNIGAWNSKERLEQEYVTRYISKVLSKYNLADVELEGPYTKKAGDLLHLRTDFSFCSEGLKDKLGKFLNELHPTPAVCGMPRKEALKLLQNLEIHKREYYSGFLGPFGINHQLALFVNLRCMKVLIDRLALFVGGGITADSVPEDEWQETEIKAETLLSVIRQLNFK